MVDFSIAKIESLDQALEVLEPLRGKRRTPEEDITYRYLLNKFEIEEDEDAEEDDSLSQDEVLLIASDFYLFVKYAFRKRFGFKWVGNWHHELICRELEKVFMGMQPRLIINIPPRYSKTILLTHFIAWCHGHYPDSQSIYCSYSGSLSEEQTAAIREIIDSDFYRSVFPRHLRKDSKSKKDFKMLEGGRVLATSTGGTLTGKGAGLKILGRFSGLCCIDDPIKPDDAASETVRNNCNNWYNSTMQSRFALPYNEPSKEEMSELEGDGDYFITPVIVIMQRLAEEDLSGFLIERSSDPWRVLRLPAIITAQQVRDVEGPEHLYKDKDADDEMALWPMTHNLVKLHEMRGDTSKPGIGSYIFAGQYQQLPAPDDGGILKNSWFRTYESIPWKDVERTVMTADTAQTKTARADFTVLQHWAITRHGAYLVDMLRAKYEAPELKRAVLNFYQKHRPDKFYLEYKSSGIGLVQSLKSEYSIPVIPVPRDTSSGDKIVRASEASPYIESGMIYLPSEAQLPVVDKLLEEARYFPNGKHDDCLDPLIDLIKLELIPNANTLSPMELQEMPMSQESMFGQLMENEPDNFINNDNPWMSFT